MSVIYLQRCNDNCRSQRLVNNLSIDGCKLLAITYHFEIIYKIYFMKA